MRRILVLLLSPVLSFAQDPVLSNDSHLGAPPSFTATALSSNLKADRSTYVPGGNGLSVNVYRVVKGKNVLVKELPWQIPSCQKGQSVSGSAPLTASRYTIISGWSNYQVTFDSKCGGTLNLFFENDSPGGQALGIWHVATTAKNKLASHVGLAFWKYQVRIKFPASSNYYTNNTVNISRGDHWDVVAHELGHAIYDQAQLGVFGGGNHSLTKCYNSALALSEGWATYFATWLFLSLDDPDAHLEFIGGIPMQVENVPSHVCKGPTNEWRVASFFWDMVDTHNDGELTDQAFSKTFRALLGKKVNGADAAARAIAGAGVPNAVINDAWSNSFLTNRN